MYSERKIDSGQIVLSVGIKLIENLTIYFNDNILYIPNAQRFKIQ